MTRQARLHFGLGCAALGLIAGCASVKRSAPDAPVPAPVDTNAVAAASAVTSYPPPPEGGYAWEDLARLAATNCTEAKVLMLEADAERAQAAVDTGWRNPQLRLGQSWGDEDHETPGRSGYKTYPQEYGSPSRPFTENGKWSDRDFDSYTVGLRAYIANPFVNRWLRRRGASAAKAVEAASDEAQYAVFCEVKSLCLEAEALREEIELLEQMAQLREQVRDARNEQVQAKVAGVLDQIRAETRLATLRSEIRERQMVRQQMVRRIAVLTGLPAEQLRLRAPAFGATVDAAYLSAAALTDLAFARRPDLQKALHEKEAAAHGVKAAQAGQVPWFEYVEGTYQDGSGHTDSYEANVSGHDRTSEDQTEWQARVAVTIPVFNWLGDELRLNRTKLSAAETRVQGLYDDIRREVEGALVDYSGARGERNRIADECSRLCQTISAQLDAVANETTVRREDVWEAREELLGYRRVCMKAEHEYLRLTQYLETVSGGSLAPAR